MGGRNFTPSLIFALKLCFTFQSQITARFALDIPLEKFTASPHCQPLDSLSQTLNHRLLITIVFHISFFACRAPVFGSSTKEQDKRTDCLCFTASKQSLSNAHHTQLSPVSGTRRRRRHREALIAASEIMSLLYSPSESPGPILSKQCWNSSTECILCPWSNSSWAEDPRTEVLRRYSYGVALPSICLLGIVGNILNLVVLTRRNMKGTAYIYMRGENLPTKHRFLYLKITDIPWSSLYP